MMRAAPTPVILLALAACGGTPETSVSTPILEVELAGVRFGQVFVGNTARTELRVFNPGHARLEVEAGSSAAILSLQPSELRLEPGTFADIRVEVRPEQPGPLVLPIHLTSNDPARPRVDLLALGEALASPLRLGRSHLELGGVVVGQAGEQPLVLQNLGEASIEVRIGGLQRCVDGHELGFCVRSSDASLPIGGLLTLEGGASIELVVELRPEAVTRYASALSLRTCEKEACLQSVTVSGHGLRAPLGCEPMPVDLGTVLPGRAVEVFTRCTNVTLAPLDVDGWRVEPEGGPIKAIGSRSTSLGPGESLDIPVYFAPSELGLVSGTLVVDAALETRVELSGVGGGPALRVEPAHLEFGPASLLVPSKRRITVSNDGYAPLTLTDVGFEQSGLGVFHSLQGAEVIEPGKSVSFVVEFAPQEELRYQAYLSLKTNDPEASRVRLPLSGSGRNLGPCNYEVSSRALDFFTVPVGRNLTRTLRIYNRGTTPCLMTSALVDGSGEFSLRSPPFAEIAPGQQHDVTLEFRPDGGMKQARLSLGLSNPFRPDVGVDLSGRGVAEQTLLSPADLDFGPVRIGCRSVDLQPRLHLMTGTSIQVLSVRMVDDDGGAFVLGALPDFPLGLSRRWPLLLSVGFHPIEARSYAGLVEVVIDDGMETRSRVLTLSGVGSDDGVAKLSVVQADRPADLLFVLDRTAGMDQVHQLIGQNFGRFDAWAHHAGVAWQASVTTTDTDDEAGRVCSSEAGMSFSSSANGPLAQRIVDHSSRPSPEQAFRANVSFRITGGGSNDESGLEAAALALAPGLLAEHNRGLLRPGGHLAIIFASNAADRSPGSTSGYLDIFHAAVDGDPNRFSASAIVAPKPRCSGPRGHAWTLGRYDEVAARSGGEAPSICESIDDAIERIAPVSLGLRTRFFLRHPADEHAVPSVRVDGVPVPSQQGDQLHWSFDREQQAIVFAPTSAPPPGAQLSVEYATSCL